MPPDLALAEAPALRPGSEAELAEAIAQTDGPLAIAGGGTRPVGRPVAGRALTTAGLTGITLYEPGALTLIARAGTPVAEIEQTLAAEDQRLAFEPMDHRRLLASEGIPTIGGVAAANVSGPRRIQAGACRDAMLGVRFVDGRGQILKNGGRVMKNVTGYDLVKLMAGSHGTLGVLTEISLKVLPQVETEATIALTGLDPASAVKALSTALGAPFEVTGAAHLAADAADAPRTLIRIEGFAGSVAYRAKKLRDLLGQGAEIETAPSASAGLWRRIRDVEPLAGRPGDVWRLSVRPSEAAGLVAKAGDPPALFDWGGGLFWLLLPEGTDLRGKLGGFGGHATLVRASAETRGQLPVFQPQPAPLARLSEGLRRQFDPRGILNPGLMG